MSVQLAVLVNVDSLTAIAHRVGPDIGVINATHHAVNVTVTVYSMMVLVLTVSTDCGGGCVNMNAAGSVSANVKKEVVTAHPAASGIGAKTGKEFVSLRATKDVPQSVRSRMEPVPRVLTGSGETVVRMRVHIVYQENVAVPMDIVYFAWQASGADIVPCIAVLVARQTHVVLLMARVHLVKGDTGENGVISYAAKGVPISVHNLTGRVHV